MSPLSQTLSQDQIAINDDLLSFLHASPTPYHAVYEGKKRLQAFGAKEICERDDLETLKPGFYFFCFGDTSLFAFSLPQTKNQTSCFRVVGAHTDSPNLRLKYHAEYTKESYKQLGVEVYGGALIHSWFDRDLSVAGRIFVQSDDGLTSSLVKIDKPLCRVAQLAIHLDRDVVEKGFHINKQEHLPPILGLATSPQSLFEELLSSTQIKKGVKDILGFDLMLFDTLAPCLGGLSQEFLFSARLDNLAMCHAALTACIENRQAVDNVIPVVALFDHEEVGSGSAYGAESSVFPRLLERIAGSRQAFLRMLSRSSCISADMAHAVHPNYADRHEAKHRPVINMGPVIKQNSQQRYATSAQTAAQFRALCKKIELPCQTYVHRSDLACGSTIGPITSTLLGIPTIDVGNPMLSMHSVREMGGSKDPLLMTSALSHYFSDPF